MKIATIVYFLQSLSRNYSNHAPLSRKTRNKEIQHCVYVKRHTLPCPFAFNLKWCEPYCFSFAWAHVSLSFDEAVT